jgi:hypothetical protein
MVERQHATQALREARREFYFKLLGECHMNRYTIKIRYRGYRWTLHAIARSSADALCSVLDHVGPGCLVTVRAA